MDNNLFPDTEYNRYIQSVNKSIFSTKDKKEQMKMINKAMNHLRIKHNQDPANYHWGHICNWYTGMQRLCDMPYVDQYACLYPSILNVDDIIKNIKS